MYEEMSNDLYEETLQYDGCTTIERVVHLAGTIWKRTWLLFDTVEEAQTYYTTFGNALT